MAMFFQYPQPVPDGMRAPAPEDGEVLDGVNAFGRWPRSAEGLADPDAEGARLPVHEVILYEDSLFGLPTCPFGGVGARRRS